MGFTYVKVRVYNPGEPRESETVELLVDCGALFTSIPREILERLGLKSIGTRKLKVYGGKVIERDICIAGIEYEGKRVGVTAILGEPEDTPILGVTTLESLGYELDPVSKKLKPVELLMI